MWRVFGSTSLPETTQILEGGVGSDGDGGEVGADGGGSKAKIYKHVS